jgi:hypothetical protein
VLKLAGVVTVCAATAFAAAFLIARSGNSAPRLATKQFKPVALGDPAATAVALRFTGRPAPLKLPRRRHVKRHPKPAAKVTPAPAPTPAPTYTPTVPTPSPPPPPPPVHKHSGGKVGIGTTTIR